jgi:hypothetical protein
MAITAWLGPPRWRLMEGIRWRTLTDPDSGRSIDLLDTLKADILGIRPSTQALNIRKFLIFRRTKEGFVHLSEAGHHQLIT